MRKKNYFSLYVGNIDEVANSKTLLKGLNLGKGCIRIKNNIETSETKLDEFISQTIQLWDKVGDSEY